jgi:hypothetical protein
MNHLLRLGSLLVFYLLVGCSQEQVLELPAPPQLIVVNALFTPDSTWRVVLSQTVSVNDTAQQGEPISDARVELWADEVLQAVMIETQTGSYELDEFPLPGVPYTLRVMAEGFPPVEATDRIPPLAVDLSGSIDTSEVIAIFDGGFSLNPNYYRAEVTFRDQAVGRSYYRILGHFHDSVIVMPGLYSTDPPDTNFLYDRLNPLYFYTNDGDVSLFSQNEQKYLLLTDRNFEGNFKSVLLHLSRFYFFSDERGGVVTSTGGEIDLDRNPRKYMQIYVELRSMSEAYYRFAATYLQQGYNTGDALAIHNNVFSNVQGGKGIFAGYQSSWQQIF